MPKNSKIQANGLQVIEETQEVDVDTIDLDEALSWMNINFGVRGRGRSGGNKSNSQSVPPPPPLPVSPDVPPPPPLPVAFDVPPPPPEPEAVSDVDAFLRDFEPQGLPSQKNFAVQLIQGPWPPQASPAPSPVVMLPSFVVPPPPPPPQPDVPPPPAGPNFVAEIPGIAEDLQNEMRRIAKLARKDADNAEAFMKKWGTYFEMKEHWAEFVTNELHVNDWHPDTDRKFEKACSDLRTVKSQFAKLSDQSGTSDGRAAAKALQLATMFEQRATEWIMGAESTLRDIEGDLSSATSADSLGNQAVAQGLWDAMAPQRPIKDNVLEQQTKEFEQQQEIKKKQAAAIDDLKRMVNDWAIINDIAEVYPKAKSDAQKYQQFAGFVNNEDYAAATAMLSQSLAKEAIASFVSSTDHRRQSLMTTIDGLQKVDSADENFTGLVGRSASMVSQLKAASCVDAHRLMEEIEPNIRQALALLPNGLKQEISILQTNVGSPVSYQQTDQRVRENLADRIQSSIDFESSFAAILTAGGNTDSDVGFNKDILRTTQELLSKYTPTELSTEESRAAALDAFQYHVDVLSTARDELLKKTPLVQLQQARADLIHEYIEAINAVITLLSAQGLKNLQEHERINERREQLQQSGDIDRMRAAVDALVDPLNGMDRRDRSKELVALLKNADKATRHVLLEAAIDSDGLTSILLEMKNADVEEAVETIKAARGDDAVYVDRLIEQTIAMDVRNTVDMSSFMRSKTSSTVILAAFTNDTEAGKNFIRSSTQSSRANIKALNIGPDKDVLSMDLQLNKVQETIKGWNKKRSAIAQLDIPQEIAPEVIEKHRKLVGQMVDSITNQMPPDNVTRAMASLYEQTLAKFQTMDTEVKGAKTPEQMALSLVGGHIFLRMINSALYSLDFKRDVTKEQFAAMTIQSKVLQNLSNQTAKAGFLLDAMPDHVSDEDGNPSPEVVRIGAYLKKIVLAGQKARGNRTQPTELNWDANALARELQKEAGILHNNLQPLLLGKGRFADETNAMKQLKTFLKKFPFDLVSKLHSLSQTVENGATSETDLLADVEAAAKSGISTLAKYDDILAEAETATGTVVQIRGRVGVILGQISNVAACEVKPSQRPRVATEGDIRRIANSTVIDQMAQAVGNDPAYRHIHVLLEKLERLRTFVQASDFGAATERLAIDVLDATTRDVAAFEQTVRAELAQMQNTMQTILRLGNGVGNLEIILGTSINDVAGRVNAAALQQDPVIAYNEMMAVAAQVKVSISAASSHDADELFEQLASPGPELRVTAWTTFLQTLPDNVIAAHEAMLTKVGKGIAAFEDTFQDFGRNLLDPSAVAATSTLTQRLYNDLNSIRTSHDPLKNHVAALTRQLIEYVRRHNETIIASLSVESLWNLSEGPMYLMSISEAVDASENIRYMKVLEQIEQEGDGGVMAESNRLAGLVEEFFENGAQPPNIDNRSIKLITQALSLMDKSDEQSRKQVISKIRSTVRKSRDELWKNMRGTFLDVRKHLFLSVDFV